MAEWCLICRSSICGGHASTTAAVQEPSDAKLGCPCSRCSPAVQAAMLEMFQANAHLASWMTSKWADSAPIAAPSRSLAAARALLAALDGEGV